MPPIDASLYNAFAPRPVSAQDVTNGLMQQANAGLQMQGNALGLQQKQVEMQQADALREATKGLGNDVTANYNALLRTGNLKAAADYQKSVLDAQKTQSEVGLNTAHAGEFSASAAGKTLDQARSVLPMVKTPEQFAQWVDGLYQNPATSQLVTSTFGPPDQVKARIPTDPQQFQTFLQQNAMGMDKFIQNQTQIRGQDLTAKTSAENNAATNKTHLQAANIAASTSRANNAATIAKDYTIAGIGPDGSPSANVESMAQMIAAGKVAPITGFALARPQGQAVMARVSQINPQYDATEYGAKVKAAKDFTTGNLGNAMRSFAVAGDHLDQLGKLADALNNKDTQAINRIGNFIAQQTGSPAPTNFDAAKEIVGKEVVKAIVAGGGGVTEREEMSRLMDKANSPAQLKGVITQFKALMDAQHAHLLQQRDAAGLPRSSLPDYGSKPDAGVPPDIAEILKKHGK